MFQQIVESGWGQFVWVFLGFVFGGFFLFGLVSFRFFFVCLFFWVFLVFLSVTLKL